MELPQISQVDPEDSKANGINSGLHPEILEVLEEARRDLECDSMNLDDLPIGEVLPAEFVEKLSQLTHMTELALSNCGLKNLSNMPYLPNIENLELNENNITLEGLLGLRRTGAEVAKAANLSGSTPTTIADESKPENTETAAEKVTSAFPKLKILQLNQNPLGNQTKESLIGVLEAIHQLFPKLHTLELDGCPINRVADHHQIAFEKIPTLKILNMLNAQGQEDMVDDLDDDFDLTRDNLNDPKSAGLEDYKDDEDEDLEDVEEEAAGTGLAGQGEELEDGEVAGLNGSKPQKKLKE